MKEIVIIDYGAGNVQSVKLAVERLGFSAKLSDDESIIRNADKVIFPGVGEASSAMKVLKEKGLDDVIRNLKQPLLGICLGLQLLCEKTEESDTIGLGIFPVQVKKFPKNPLNLKVPQMGWNQIEFEEEKLFTNIEQNSYTYFVHSYYAEVSEFTIATTNYILPFSAALQKDNFYATQFHPERSGEIGGQILNNFLML